MHIAICDDDIAGRKQLERLLSRESDSRLETGEAFYTDSYGDAASLLHSPMLYDLFWIDLTTNHYIAMDTVRELRSIGVTAPIIMCSSKIHYEECDNLPSGLLFLTKPILSDVIPHMVDMAVEISSKKERTIELRCAKNTIYVKEREILYGKEEAQYVYVYMDDGRIVAMLGSMNDFCSLFEHAADFYLTRTNLAINLTKVVKITFTSLTLTNGQILPIRIGDKFQIQKVLKPTV